MSIKIIPLFIFFISCSTTVFSQIKPGLYAANNNSYADLWFVNVKNDTAFSEEIGTKKANVWIYQNSKDTLIKQNDNSYSGNKYVLIQKNGAVYLIEKNTKKKRAKRLITNNEILNVWNGLHNRAAMSDREIYKRYYMMTEYLRKSSQNIDDIANAFNDLEGKLYLNQQSFLVKLQKFETEYLYRKITIED